MLKKIKLSICFIGGLLLVIGCRQKNTLIIIGEPVNDKIKIYAPDCYIKNNAQDILILEGFLYKNNCLEKYITPQIEGLIIEAIQSSGLRKETTEYKRLKYSEPNNGEVILFGKRYKIERKAADTIFLDNNVIIVNNPQGF